MKMNPKLERIISSSFLLLPIYFLLYTLNFILVSCNTTEPPIDKTPPDSAVTKKIILAQKGVSATEVWLYMKTENFDSTESVTLMQNGNSIKQLFVSSEDTILYFDSLAPSTNYNYKAYLNGDTTVYGEAAIRTLDTTSHDFSYEIFTFGDLPTSSLYDVAIINENDIWAVGEIYIADTSRNGYTMYNAVHWNGQEWELRRIYYQGQCSAVNVPPLKAIISFSENEFIVTNGGSSGFFNGENITYLDCDVHPLLDGAISSMYGYSKNDYYVVGGKGTIVHYNGTSWEKIELDEDISEYYLSDIYGTADGEVYIVGVDDYFRKSVLIENASGKFKVFQRSDILPENEIFNPKLYGDLVSIWIDENGTVYTAGSYLYNLKNYKWDYFNSLPANKPYEGTYTYYRGYITSIRGNFSNDIIISGLNNTIIHFNGKTWKHLGEGYNLNSNKTWSKVEIKGNIVVAVGKEGINGIVTLLKR